MNSIYVEAFVGGAMIGIATLTLLLFNGKVAGNSGIIAGVWRVKAEGWAWRFCYVLGLLFGGIIYTQWISQEPITVTSNPLIIIAGGLLVGFGTRLGSGCTSGHGVCGMARFSKRSIVATITFMLSAFLTVYLVKVLGGAS